MTYLSRIFRTARDELRRWPWVAKFSGLVILFMLFLALVGPYIAPHHPTEQDILNRFSSPSLRHPFGTDRFGRDVLSRNIVGARYSFLIGLSSVAASLILGVIGGLVAGFYRWAQTIIMRWVDIMLSFPSLLVALIIIALLGPGMDRVIFAITFYLTPNFIRLTNSLVVSKKEEDFIEASYAAGAGDFWIITRGILPQCLAPLVIQATLFIPSAILVSASLSFLGVGVQPPIPEWGLIINEARGSLREAPHITYFTAMFMGLTILSFNLLGDTLRERLDPRIRHEAT